MMVTFEDAMKVVARMELMAYFNTVSPEARTLIAEELMAMVNWPPERIVRNGYGVVPYVEPRERLAHLAKQLKKVKDWPGMTEIRGLYCLRFTPADGVMADCTLPGITDDGVFVGEDAIGIAAVPEPVYLPAPGDEPIGGMLGDIAAAAKKLGGGK